MASAAGSGMRVVVYDEYNKIYPVIEHAMIESIESFDQYKACISFIQQDEMNDRATILVTTTIDEQILQQFEKLHAVEAILILSTKERDIDILPSKVIGIYPDIEYLLRALFEILDTIELQLDANSILFHRDKNGKDNTDFYFYYLWENHNKNKMTSKNLLIEQARVIFRSENHIKLFLHDFNTSYQSNEVLHWLNKYNHPFPFHLLVSNALRTHDQQILSFVRFFILDLTKQMKPITTGFNHHQVYFGTKLPIAIVDRLEQQTSKDIIAFQCFLPVTRSRANALFAATRPTRRRKIANVLFKIDASKALCASMGDVILLNMATPFHVTCVTRNTGSGGVQQLVTVVTLVALEKTNKAFLLEQFIQKQKKAGKSIDDFIQRTIPIVRAESDYDVHNEHRMSMPKQSIPLYVVSVTKPVRSSLAVCKEEAEADEFIKNGYWAQAIDCLATIEDPNVRVLNKHGCLLRERLQDLPAALQCHQEALVQATDRGKAETLIFLGIVHHDMKQYNESLKFYTQALQWYEQETVKDSAMIARCLIGLGNVHWARGQLDEALACAERALVLREHAVHPRNEFEIAACLGNMGNILHDQGDISRALICAQRAVDILSSCARGDPRLAAALNNLGAMFQGCKDYRKAREYFNRALKTLPDETHPYRQSTLNNIARLNEIEKAEK